MFSAKDVLKNLCHEVPDTELFVFDTSPECYEISLPYFGESCGSWILFYNTVGAYILSKC